MNLQDRAKGQDGVNLLKGTSVVDFFKENAVWSIDKWFIPNETLRLKIENLMRLGASIQELKDTFGKFYLGQAIIPGNALLNEGINEMLTLLAGGSATAFNNANSYLGVGDSSAAESASQTDLQAATNKLYKAMDSGYPTYGSSQEIVFRSTYGSSEANYAWEEFTVANASSGTGENLNRKTSSQGTKTSGQTWQLTLTIGIS